MAKFLVQLRLGTDRPMIERIRERMPAFKEEIERISKGKCTLAWTSQDGGTVAFFINANLTSGQILHRLQTPDSMKSIYDVPRKDIKGSPIHNEDQLIILQIGEDVDHQRMAQPIAWLKNH